MKNPNLTPLFRLLIVCISIMLFVTGCEQGKSSSTHVNAVGSSDANATKFTDQWIGKWNGPEGTFIHIVGGNGKYALTIQNLDGPRTFNAYAKGDYIVFERNGLNESLRASSGAETGMKWLAEKTNCLKVRTGEGYCRD